MTEQKASQALIVFTKLNSNSYTSKLSYKNYSNLINPDSLNIYSGSSLMVEQETVTLLARVRFPPTAFLRTNKNYLKTKNVF